MRTWQNVSGMNTSWDSVKNSSTLQSDENSQYFINNEVLIRRRHDGTFQYMDCRFNKFVEITGHAVTFFEKLPFDVACGRYYEYICIH